MSAFAYPYTEPHKLPAGLLALAVHAGFFALLYFGINWHTEQPQGMTVDLWNSLPPVEHAPAAPPPPEPAEPPKKVEPPKPVEPPKRIEPKPVETRPKPEIALPEKKKPKAPEPKKIQEAPKPPVQLKHAPPKISAAEQARQAAQAAAAAAAAAAITNEIGKYKGLIIAKIRRYVVMPPDVPDDAQAEFDVVLLPGGPVLSAQLTKSSGNAAYDDAVARAIKKAEPLPLPPDVSLFNQFRELHLTFRPKE